MDEIFCHCYLTEKIRRVPIQLSFPKPCQSLEPVHIRVVVLTRKKPIGGRRYSLVAIADFIGLATVFSLLKKCLMFNDMWELIAKSKSASGHQSATNRLEGE